MIYNNAIRSIRTKKKCDSMLIIRRGGTFLPTPGHVRVKENIFIMLQCRTTNSKFLRRLEPRSHK